MTDQNPITTTEAKPVPVLPDAQTVTKVTHYTDRLFSFRVTRPASLRFRSGEFVMIGLMGDPDPKTGKQKPLLRAYSIASPSWDDELEFYSIKVQDGPLTSKLQNIQVGDEVIVRPKPVGTLVLDALLPAKRMYFIATGTGIAPFASLIRDPDLYERYDEVILCHTCRETAELKYGADLVASLSDDPLIGEVVGDKLKYFPTTTQEPSARMGRITHLLKDGEVAKEFGLPPLNPETDRLMVCGSMGLNVDIKAICEAAGMTEGSNSQPAEFVVEKAFVG
ncbi:ferredoxin--NADP reductase [Neptunicoccus cionae]|uniref:ferredoxin--NADP reductase n=1 Tax=Neptunicoccus cionae TaxID=2035344 RepID=UPI000C76A5B4|nr:ferredoxin--NADP reductase [Amylibacter cionae]PLS20353.1 ferredoxin--NADP(+) reductase [Amylibacter cionae]